MFSCVRSFLRTSDLICIKQSEMLLSNTFRHMGHTIVIRSARLLCSVFMTAINYIKMTKKQKKYFCTWWLLMFFLLLLLLVTHSNFLLSPDGISRGWPIKYQIWNTKSVLYESEMNTIWMEVDKIQKGKKKSSGLSNSTSLLMVLCKWIEEVDIRMFKMCHTQIQPQILVCYIHVCSFF